MKCKLCDLNIGRHGGHFNNHLKKIHKISDFESYILITKYNNIKPLCECGCGKETNFFINDFKKFYRGHNTEHYYNKIRDLNLEKNVVDLYLNNLNFFEISKKIKINRSYFYKIIKKYGVSKNNSDSRKIYNIDENIFDEIDNEEKSYWLGFLFADGYNNTNNNSVVLTLSNYDYDILEKFNIFLKTNKLIRKNNDNSSKVAIENKRISKKLELLGMVKAKTHILKFPNINKNLEKHFIRGYFDGDGCISYGKNINNSATISITSTKDFLNEIEKRINIKFSYIKRHKNRKDNIYTLTTGGIGNIMKFYHYLYCDSTIFMNRKHNKFKIWIENYFLKTKITKITKNIKKELNL